MNSLVARAFSLMSATLILAGCSGDPARAAGKGPADAEAVVKVSLVEAAPRTLPTYLAVTGTLLAHEDSDVAANAAGRVLETYVERGSFVVKGAPLVRLDAKTAELSASEARAMAEATRAQKGLAEADCARADKLRAQGAVNQADYERMKAQCEATRASAEAAAARVELAGKAVSDSMVRAPFAGMVVERFTAVGEYVMPSSRVVTLVAVDPLRLELTIPERSISAVSPGQVVEFEVSAYPKEKFQAVVRYVGPALRRASRDLVVEAVVKNEDKRLKPGIFAVARIVTGEESLPVVPKAALRSEGGAVRLFTARDGRAEERVVQTGLELADGVAIRVGVAAGEKVVGELSGDVRDGVRIQ
jgi:membrane fusion protein (multidrug efflux system)